MSELRYSTKTSDIVTYSCVHWYIFQQTKQQMNTTIFPTYCKLIHRSIGSNLGPRPLGMLGGNLVSETARPKHNYNISYNIVLIFANISNCPRAPWGFVQEWEDGDLVSKTAAQYITPCCDQTTCCPIPKYIFHKVKDLRVSGFCYSCVWIIFFQLCITAL